MRVSDRYVKDVRGVGSKALPTPQHLMHGTDHSAPYLHIQGWLFLLGLKLSCGEKESLVPRGCSGARAVGDSILRGLGSQGRGATQRDLALPSVWEEGSGSQQSPLLWGRTTGGEGRES